MKDFLTYAGKHVLENETELSQSINAFVGENGSGKSSLLKAITFVLTDNYIGLTKQEKRGLLNNLAMQASLTQRQDRATAHTYWVEVVLDNRELKIPIDAAEVAIKRTYHCSTDREEYHVNGSTIAQRDLFGLLESANA